jgi:hypothetical protein
MPSTPPSPELTIAGKRIVRVQRWSRRRSVRGKLFLVFVLATVLTFTSHSKQLFVVWEAILVFDVLFVLWPFFQGTYLLYTRGSSPLHAGFKQTDAAFFDGLHEFQDSPLPEMGFTFAGCLKQERETTGVTTEVALLVHVEQEDSV